MLTTKQRHLTHLFIWNKQTRSALMHSNNTKINPRYHPLATMHTTENAIRPTTPLRPLRSHLRNALPPTVINPCDQHPESNPDKAKISLNRIKKNTTLLLLSFNEVQRCFAIDNVNTTRLIRIANAIALRGHKNHFWSESRADKLPAAHSTLLTTARWIIA